MSHASEKAGAAPACPEAGSDQGPEKSFLRYVWRNSWREQTLILLMIAASIPIYYAALELPRLIVSDAIEGESFGPGQETAKVFRLAFTLPEFLGGRSIVLSNGVELTRVGYLLSLSFLFLALVLLDGALKYVINMRKGILGERLLRRLRYDLFGQLMRFPPEEIRAVKPAEAASMIRDEIEPIGGFGGDAFIQPALLGTQALTALAFIMIQNLWVGLVALLGVVLQTGVLLVLRLKLLRLGRERLIESRRLAGRIGEIVDAAPAIQGHGATMYIKSEISSRLGKLFDIRFALFRERFLAQHLNNVVAQVIPFFFYAIGGYFALRGSLDIGQLVAVIAAYQGLPPPIQGLIGWDQARTDVNLKYDQVIRQFTPQQALTLDDEHATGEAEVRLGPRGEIHTERLRVKNSSGSVLLEPLSLRIARPGFAALVGPAGSGRDVAGRVLARQTLSYSGKATIDGHEISSLSMHAASRLIGYAGPETEIVQGSLRDNIDLSLKHNYPRMPARRDQDPEQRHAQIESIESGNTPLPHDADWTDYGSAGIVNPADLDAALRTALRVLGLEGDVYDLGLNGHVIGDHAEDVRLLQARAAVADELKAAGLEELVETFDVSHYNSNASIGKNLLFGAVLDERWSSERLFDNPDAMAILRSEGLADRLLDIGANIVTTLREVFSGLPPGHALFDRYDFARSLDLDTVNALGATVAKGSRPSPEIERQLFAIALDYIEPKHRLALVDPDLRTLVLRARADFRRFIERSDPGAVEFYDPERVIHGATVRDNILFGRPADTDPGVTARLFSILEAALKHTGLDAEIYRLGLDADTGLNGRNLPPCLRVAVPLMRALIKRPNVHVLDLTAILPLTDDPEGLIDRLRRHCEGSTLIVLVPDARLVAMADPIVQFVGVRGQPVSKSDDQAGADPSRTPSPVGAAQ